MLKFLIWFVHGKKGSLKFLLEFNLLGVDEVALNAYLSFRTEQTSKENWNLKLKWTYQYFWVEDLDHTAQSGTDHNPFWKLHCSFHALTPWHSVIELKWHFVRFLSIDFWCISSTAFSRQLSCLPTSQSAHAQINKQLSLYSIFFCIIFVSQFYVNEINCRSKTWHSLKQIVSFLVQR